MIWPILEAMAGFQKYSSSVFGSNENFEICFWDQLTFSLLGMGIGLNRKNSYLFHFFHICVNILTSGCQQFLLYIIDFFHFWNIILRFLIIWKLQKEMVFCYRNFSDLLWEKKFKYEAEGRGICKKNWDHLSN